MAWMADNSMPENMPYIFLPLLIVIQMSINAFMREQNIVSHDVVRDNDMMHFSFDYTLPLLMGGAALASPAAVSLNWHVAEILAATQFLFMKEKLKLMDGLDIEAIKQKDTELRLKMDGSHQLNLEELEFDYDNSSGNIKVQESPPASKNAVQINFLKNYNKNNKA